MDTHEIERKKNNSYTPPLLQGPIDKETCFTIKRVIGILAYDTVFVKSINISTNTRRQYCLGPYTNAFPLRNMYVVQYLTRKKEAASIFVNLAFFQLVRE